MPECQCPPSHPLDGPQGAEERLVQTRTTMSVQASQERPVDEPYSIFTTTERWGIVAIVAVAGIFRSVTRGSLDQLTLLTLCIPTMSPQSIHSQHIFPSYTSNRLCVPQV